MDKATLFLQSVLLSDPKPAYNSVLTVSYVEIEFGSFQ